MQSKQTNFMDSGVMDVTTDDSRHRRRTAAAQRIERSSSSSSRSEAADHSTNLSSHARGLPHVCRTMIPGRLPCPAAEAEIAGMVQLVPRQAAGGQYVVLPSPPARCPLWVLLMLLAATRCCQMHILLSKQSLCVQLPQQCCCSGLDILGLVIAQVILSVVQQWHD